MCFGGLKGLKRKNVPEGQPLESGGMSAGEMEDDGVQRVAVCAETGWEVKALCMQLNLSNPKAFLSVKVLSNSSR